MKHTLACLIIGFSLSSVPAVEGKIPPAGYAVATFATVYVVGNLYARYIERATYHRFKEEMEQLQHLDGAHGVITQILQKHHESLNIGFFSRLYSRLHLLPVHKIEAHLRNYPFVQCRKDITSYLNSIWWSQWWALFTPKYHDIGSLKVCLEQLKEIILTDYRYTKELRSLSGQ